MMTPYESALFDSAVERLPACWSALSNAEKDAYLEQPPAVRAFSDLHFRHLPIEGGAAS